MITYAFQVVLLPAFMKFPILHLVFFFKTLIVLQLSKRKLIKMMLYEITFLKNRESIVIVTVIY